jgi:hypothetical protein
MSLLAAVSDGGSGARRHLIPPLHFRVDAVDALLEMAQSSEHAAQESEMQTVLAHGLQKGSPSSR